jgi:NAD(P)-dependent dehydrogenase (short-subunit alcohol dehydrogenase family)
VDLSERILITGANRGIGLALSRELVSQGHALVLCARDPAKADKLRELADGAKGSISIVALDVDSDESVEQAKREVAARFDGLDVLVNNAAVFPEEGNETLAEMELRWFREAFETNVLGVVRVTRAFAPLFEKGENPRIVNISSLAGSIAQKEDHGYYAYSASKAALNMVTRAVAAEYKPRGICVVALSPGWVKTDMGGPNAPLTPEESARAIAETISALTMKKTGLFMERTGTVLQHSW